MLSYLLFFIGPVVGYFIGMFFRTLLDKRKKHSIDRENDFWPEDSWVENKAPYGKYRIIREDVRDGSLSIVAQFDVRKTLHVDVARDALEVLINTKDPQLKDDDQPVYTMWNDGGFEIRID